MDPQLQQRAAKIRLLLMDVDGVLTTGLIYNVPGAHGDVFETKGFNSQDGIALQWLIWNGFQTGVITGRDSPFGAACEKCRPHAQIRRSI